MDVSVRYWDGGLISSVKMSSVKALAMARSSRVSNWAQGFAMAPHQHGQAVVVIIGHSNAADGANHADGNFAVIDQFRDIRQG